MTTERTPAGARLTELDVRQPIWDQFYWVAPLVLVGTREPDGDHDLAPKHMAMPMGWSNYFGFVCTPRHRTHANVRRTGEFTVSYPRPKQLVLTSLAASPRGDHGEKVSLTALPVFDAEVVDGVLLDGAYLYLECRLRRIVEGLGVNELIIGEVVRALLDERAARRPDGDDPLMLHDDPLLAYLHPGRFAAVSDTRSFPFPAGMKK